jgi:hypothetical protein
VYIHTYTYIYKLFLKIQDYFNSLNAELNLICHLLALLGAHHILRVSRIRVNIWRKWGKKQKDVIIKISKKEPREQKKM